MSDIVQIRANRALLEQLFSRDNDGYRLVPEWSEPGPDGFSELTITRDMSDNLLDKTTQARQQQTDGGWVPAVPLAYPLWFRLRCSCGRKFWRRDHYEQHWREKHV